MNEMRVYEMMIPAGYASVMFFQDKETMQECCEKWNLEPAIDDEIQKAFPHLFVALRRNDKFSFNCCCPTQPAEA